MQTLKYLVENVATHNHSSKTVNTGFDWSKQAQNLTNSANDRGVAAHSLSDYVVVNHIKGEPITLIGYSHGGNVAIQAAPLISEALGDIEVNIITLATPASNDISGTLSRDGISKGDSRFMENPTNTAVQRAVLDLYHFYHPNDPVAGKASMLYERSDVKYREGTGVTNIRINPSDVPGKQMQNAHSFPYFTNSVVSAWNRMPALPRQRPPLTTKQ